MKALKKARQAEKPKQRKGAVLQRLPARASREDPGLRRVMDLWKEEVKDLASREFSSPEEGLNALAEKVLLRFKMSGDQKMKEFLIEMLSDDPLILSEVRKALRV